MKKYDIFIKSLHNLNDIYSYQEPYDNVTMTGMVALYSICFEQSWKMMKELMEQAGIDMAQTGSPRSIIKVAYQVGMIEEEELWLLENA